MYEMGRQHSSLVAHWCMVPGDQSLNMSGGEKNSPFIFEL